MSIIIPIILIIIVLFLLLAVGIGWGIFAVVIFGIIVGIVIFFLKRWSNGQ